MIKVFPVIRAAFDIEQSDLILTPADCEELVAFGRKQSILPVVYEGLTKFNIPSDILKSADNARNIDLRLYVLHNDALHRICSALDNASIPYIPLKGAVLREFYPKPEMRTASDIDVLVHEEDVEKAREVLEADTDFKTDHRAYHDISMLNAAVHLELHFSLKENSENIDKLLSNAWEYAEPTQKKSRYAFTPEFQIFHIVAHMSYHFLHGGLGIRPFLDLWLIRTKTKYDENTVRSMCSQCGILTFYEECCNLACCWLENGAYTETAQLLEEFCLSGGVFGSREFKNAARQRDRRGIRYIISRICPPTAQVREYYGDSSGKPHSSVYYYIKRWISWFKRRKQLKAQIGEIMSSDKEYIDHTDDLLQRLGMKKTAESGD